MNLVRIVASLLALVALASGAQAQVCGESLAGFGPIIPATGFPQYYIDHSGLALELCVDDPLLCLAPKPNLGAPASVPGNFPDETFYWETDTSIPLPSGGTALIVMATEATFANGTIVVGDQVTFTRLRIRAKGVTPNANYTFTHPFGTDVLQADNLGNLTFTEDSLFFGGAAFPQVNFSGPLAGRVGPFLIWDASAPAPPTGWLGIPTVLHKITGSPCGQNFFRIRGNGLPSAGLTTDLFTVQAKKAEICGNTILDATEECDDGNTRDGDCCSSTCKFEPAGSACANTCQVGTTTCDGAGVCTGGSPILTQSRCDDGNGCSVGTTCSAGQCVGGTSVPPCAVTSVDADAVIAQSSPTTKFGTAKTLEIDGSPVRQGLFHVTVSGTNGQPIQNATLRLKATKTSGANSDSGGRIHLASCAWTESTVTWNTRPTIDPAVISTVGPVALNGEAQFDVTGAITGDGVYCFAIDSLSPDNVIYNSREASAALRPTLVIKTGCASCTAPVCGDGVINRPAEACDGFDDAACPGRCKVDCTCAPPPVCGDGAVNQPSEQCDGADNAACPNRCRPDCTCPPPPVCGDNFVNQGSEQCDGTDSSACPGACQADCTCPAGTPVGAVVADAYVTSAAGKTTTNFGNALISEIDNAPSTFTFVRVRIGNLGPRTVSSATLRMQIASAAGSNSNLRGRIHVAPCTWDEALLTWANKPAFTATVLNAPAGTAPLNQVVDFNITPAITGAGDFCFAIDTTSSDNADYNSREAATGRPQVLLTTICTTCVCGNNAVDQASEQCDGTSDAACPGLCQGNCLCAVCGDNAVNTPSEVCDGTADSACPGLCKPDCTCGTPPVCGNNLKETGEQCDGTDDAACPGACQVDCTCPIPPAPPVATVVADTYVASATPTTNFGTATTLGADGSPFEQTFLRITTANVGARTVTSAKLRMQVANASDMRGRIHNMADCSWIETAVTWNTKPTFDAAVLNAPTGTAVVGNIVEFDLTGAITGDGTKCFAIDQTSTDGVQYKSREGTALRPEVVLTVAP